MGQGLNSPALNLILLTGLLLLAAVAGPAEASPVAGGETSPALLRSLGVATLVFGGAALAYAIGRGRALRESEAQVRDLETELSHLSRVADMGEMAAALAHEMNQPLTAMANFLSAAERLLQAGGETKADEAASAVRLAAGQAERAGDIVRRMRDFVRRGETDTGIEDLPRMVEDAAGLATILTRQHPVDIRLDLDPRARDVLANRVQIQQVLVNLMRNAIDAMRDQTGPCGLNVVTRRLGDEVEVTVADTGPGIAPAVARTLFNPFVSTKPGGMGVGLFISRRIVQAHGGRMWVEPGPEGGAVFRFTLAAIPMEAAHAA